MKRGLTLIELVVVVGIVLILVALATTSVSSIISRAEERKTRTGMSLFRLAIQEYESSTGRRLTMSSTNNINNVQGRPFDMRRAELHALTTAEISRVLLRHQPSADILSRIDPSLIGVVRIGPEATWVPKGFVDPQCPDPDLRARQQSTIESAMNAFAALPYSPQDSPYTGLNSLVLLDSWGSAVRAIHPGPRAYLTTSGEIDLTVFPLNGAYGNAAGLLPDGDGTVSRRVEAIYLGAACPNAQIAFASAGPDLKFGDKRELEGECFLLSLDNIIDDGGTQ